MPFLITAGLAAVGLMLNLSVNAVLARSVLADEVIVPRETQPDAACCMDGQKFRLRISANIGSDEPHREAKLRYFEPPGLTAYAACEGPLDLGERERVLMGTVWPGSKGEKDISLTSDPLNASVFQLETKSPEDSTAQLFHKLLIASYNSSYRWDDSFQNKYVSEGADRVAGQGWPTLTLTSEELHATNFTTTNEDRLVYDNGHLEEPPFMMCYDSRHRRTYAMIYHRTAPPGAGQPSPPPETKNDICTNAWFYAERLSAEELRRAGF